MTLLFRLKNFRSILSTILSITLITLMFNPTAHAQATVAQVCSNIDYEDPTPWQIVCPVITFINVMVLSAGAVFVGVIGLGSLKLSTAVGDPKAASGGKMTINYGVIGFVGMLSLYIVLNSLGSLFGIQGGILGTGIFDLAIAGIQQIICSPDGPPLVDGVNCGP